MKKIRGITPYKPTSIEKNGVRYIVDEDADLQMLRNHKRRNSRINARRQKGVSVYAAAFQMLQESASSPVTAPDIAEELACLDPQLDVSVADVRWAMAQPGALHLFERTQIPTVKLVGWRLKK
jgi:hypothetical protein